MHSRRARPTLRLLVEDLTADWASPYPRRVLTSGSFEDLHPLSELPHPIVAKAADSFRHDGDTDTFVGSIASSTTVPLMEIKAGQWRGGVWRDDTSGVHWLVVAGLAKGGHEDRDDFYEQIRRHDHTDEPLRWLPTDEDRRLLKQETAARLLTLWELSVQDQLLEALRAIHAGGTQQVEIAHPITRDAVATLTITVTLVREPDYAADEVDLELTPTRAHAGSNLLWQLTLRALITLSPPEQGWDRYKDTFSTIAEPGYLTARVAALEALTADHELAESEPGHSSHYAHRQHLAGSTINGTAVRALCGAYFVPTQDHETLPCCQTCQTRFKELPA